MILKNVIVFNIYADMKENVTVNNTLKANYLIDETYRAIVETKNSLIKELGCLMSNVYSSTTSLCLYY